MSVTSKRIVLVDPLGEVLFSGASMIASDHEDRALTTADSAETEAERAARDACPETQRSPSDGSGIFRAVRRVTIAGEDDQDGEDDDLHAAVEWEIPLLRKKTA